MLTGEPGSKSDGDVASRRGINEEKFTREMGYIFQSRNPPTTSKNIVIIPRFCNEIFDLR